MRIEEVQHVRVISGRPISIAVGEIEVPAGTIKGMKPDKKGVITMDMGDLRQIIGEEVDRRLRSGRK
jgi:hypothetical protein